MKTGCIYLYTNKINGMKYVGQTVCKLKKRHWEHLNRDNSYIDRALRKYGESNFTLEIVEDNVNIELLDEREIYWIDFYNSFNNGYNLTRGGGGGNRFNETIGWQIIDKIQNTNLSFLTIAQESNCSIYTVSEINNGNTFYQKTIQYPIRAKRCSDIYNQNTLNTAIDYLKNTNFSCNKIAELMEVKESYIHDVNIGRVKGDYQNNSTPIRSNKVYKPTITVELIETVIKYLKQDKGASEIGDILNIPAFTVGAINRGSLALCKKLNYAYPIQTKPHRTRISKLSEQQVKEIVDLLLNTTLPLEEIAKRYSVHKSTIKAINLIQNWQSLLKNYAAPIRTNPKNKKNPQ